MRSTPESNIVGTGVNMLIKADNAPTHHMDCNLHFIQHLSSSKRISPPTIKNSERGSLHENSWTFRGRDLSTWNGKIIDGRKHKESSTKESNENTVRHTLK